MYPHERSLVKKLADKPFALIGINSDSKLAQKRARFTTEGITWRSFWNGTSGTNGAIAEQWNIKGWPSIFVLDDTGRIRAVDRRGEALERTVDELLEELADKEAQKDKGTGGK